jgi:hypothetical protein
MISGNRGSEDRGSEDRDLRRQKTGRFATLRAGERTKNRVADFRGQRFERTEF